MSSPNFHPKKDSQTSLRTCPTCCQPRLKDVTRLLVCIVFNYQLNHRPSGRNQFFLRVSCLPNESFFADARGGTPGNSWWWCAARFFKSWPSWPLQTKKCNFPQPFSHQTSKNPYPFSDLTLRQKLFNHYLAGRKQKILQILFKFAYFFLLSLSLLIFHDKYVQTLP